MTRSAFYPLPPVAETAGYDIATRATRAYVESELTDTGDIIAAAMLTDGRLMTWDGQGLAIYSPGIADAVCAHVLDLVIADRRLSLAPRPLPTVQSKSVTSATDRKAA